MFWHPLHGKCSHNGLVWSVFPVQMREKNRAKKSSKHRYFLCSVQVLRFKSLNLFLCLNLELSSFLWLRKSFSWCSMIKVFRSIINSKCLFFSLVGIFSKFKTALNLPNVFRCLNVPLLIPQYIFP